MIVVTILVMLYQRAAFVGRLAHPWNGLTFGGNRQVRADPTGVPARNSNGFQYNTKIGLKLV